MFTPRLAMQPHLLGQGRTVGKPYRPTGQLPLLALRCPG